MSLSQTKTSPMRTDSARKTSYSRSRSWWRQETFWWMTWSSSDWGQSCWGARASVRPSKTETSTATFWSAASMCDCQTRECVSVFLCLWRLFSHLWRRCNPITIHLKPIIHPPTWPSIARTHIPRNERMNYRQEWQKWKEREMIFSDVKWAYCHLPGPHDFEVRVWVIVSDARMWTQWEWSPRALFMR